MTSRAPGIAGGTPGAGWLAAAWLLSVLPFLAAGTFEIEGASRAGLALLPWLAFAGLPRAARRGGPRWTAWLVVVGMALPPVALGAALDVLAGAGRGDVLLHAGAGLGLVGLLALGADVARARPRARTAHAVAWLLLLPGAAALAVALTWIGAPGDGGPSGPVAELLRWNPLVWGHATAAADAPAPGLFAVLRPVLGAALLVALPLALDRASAGGER